STRTRNAFELGAAQQGAHVTYIDAGQTHLGDTESIEDTGAVLGRLYDGIAYRGSSQASVEMLASSSDIPVWNALTDDWHPTQALADFLTLEESVGRPAGESTLAFVGDGRDNVVHSLLVTGAALGSHVRIACPVELSPRPDIVERARSLASRTGGTIEISDDPRAMVDGADAVYTDVWVSMGESDELWAQRARALTPYRVTPELMAATGNPRARFMHCLPAVHDATTRIGERMRALTGLIGAEVADEVFRSDRSVVFQQAENRMHTIKALMVSQLTAERG
ncbi:MAG TPA: ornithine carbamoyltransferase, partial [Pseudolysinimonas sp.]|nr:ornithine carbamoyltransferase [Pseudolysinimonas sp.]